MIVVRTPKDKLFNYTEVEELYNKYKQELNDGDFSEVIKSTLFYAFYIWKTVELIGCIYFYKKDNKLFLNAFAARGHHELNLECLKESLKWFECDIYAEGLHKTSRLCLLKCGFKRVKNNLFILERRN